MTAKQITVEEFTKELWEAQREDIRKSLFDVLPESDLDASFPAWDALDQSAQEVRIKEIKEHLLQPLYMAGYEIRRRINHTG